MNLGERIQTADWKAEKHVPVIDCPDKVEADKMFLVKVGVGKEMPHPNTTEHHISWIDVYFQPDGDKFVYHVGRFEFNAHGEAVKGAIEEMQKGDKALGSKNYGQAEGHYQNALRQAPNDYAGLVSMAKCQLVQKKYGEGATYARQAKAVYPQEAQGHHLSGFAELNLKQYDAAYRDFQASQRLLPGNPATIFFMGYAQEGMNRRTEAAQEYRRYLQQVRQGKYAQHAQQRLVEWGYAR